MARIVLRAGFFRLADPQRRYRPEYPRRILVAHHLLLGDSVLLTPLIARLREQYPSAEIVLTMPVAMTSLYQGRPYGVIVWPFGLRRPDAVAAMFVQDGFDLAIVPGDNRHGWLAAALRSRWIVAHAGDRPFFRSWLIDERLPYTDRPMAIGEIFAQLASPDTPAAYWPGSILAQHTVHRGHSQGFFLS